MYWRNPELVERAICPTFWEESTRRKCMVEWLGVLESEISGTACWPNQLLKMKVKVAQSCPTLCNPVDYTVHGILQARMLEWVTFPFSRGSSQLRDRTQVSRIADGFFTSWATREAQVQSSMRKLWMPSVRLQTSSESQVKATTIIGNNGPTANREPQGSRQIWQHTTETLHTSLWTRRIWNGDRGTRVPILTTVKVKAGNNASELENHIIKIWNVWILVIVGLILEYMSYLVRGP